MFLPYRRIIEGCFKRPAGFGRATQPPLTYPAWPSNSSFCTLQASERVFLESSTPAPSKDPNVHLREGTLGFSVQLASSVMLPDLLLGQLL